MGVGGICGSRRRGMGVGGGICGGRWDMWE